MMVADLPPGGIKLRARCIHRFDCNARVELELHVDQEKRQNCSPLDFAPCFRSSAIHFAQVCIVSVVSGDGIVVHSRSVTHTMRKIFRFSRQHHFGAHTLRE